MAVGAGVRIVDVAVWFTVRQQQHDVGSAWIKESRILTNGG
jgi:hypothetical protein